MTRTLRQRFAEPGKVGSVKVGPFRLTAERGSAGRDEAFRAGWREAAFRMVDNLQRKQAQVRELAQAEHEAWRKACAAEEERCEPIRRICEVCGEEGLMIADKERGVVRWEHALLPRTKGDGHAYVPSDPGYRSPPAPPERPPTIELEAVRAMALDIMLSAPRSEDDGKRLAPSR